MREVAVVFIAELLCVLFSMFSLVASGVEVRIFGVPDGRPGGEPGIFVVTQRWEPLVSEPAGYVRLNRDGRRFALDPLALKETIPWWDDFGADQSHSRGAYVDFRMTHLEVYLRGAEAQVLADFSYRERGWGPAYPIGPQHHRRLSLTTAPFFGRAQDALAGLYFVRVPPEFTVGGKAIDLPVVVLDDDENFPAVALAFEVYAAHQALARRSWVARSVEPLWRSAFGAGEARCPVRVARLPRWAIRRARHAAYFVPPSPGALRQPAEFTESFWKHFDRVGTRTVDLSLHANWRSAHTSAEALVTYLRSAATGAAVPTVFAEEGWRQQTPSIFFEPRRCDLLLELVDHFRR